MCYMHFWLGIFSIYSRFHRMKPHCRLRKNHIFLLSVVVTLLLCLTYKFNFFIGMYVYGKTVYIGLVLSVVLGFHWVLEPISPYIRGYHWVRVCLSNLEMVCLCQGVEILRAIWEFCLFQEYRSSKSEVSGINLTYIFLL